MINIEDMSVEDLKSLVGVAIDIIAKKNDRPKGEWVNKKEVAINSRGHILYETRCSLCNALSYFRGCSGMLVGANTCPNCSADMRGDKE